MKRRPLWHTSVLAIAAWMIPVGLVLAIVAIVRHLPLSITR